MAKSSKRENILRATLKLIVQHDLENTSMDMIAKEAEVGMGTIYNYFSSKEILINELYCESKREMVRTVFEGHSVTLPLREQFIRIWHNVFYYSLEHPAVFQFLEQYSYSPIISDEAKELSWQLWLPSFELIEKAREQQILKDLPTEALLLISTSPIYSLVREAISGRINLDKSQIEAAIIACWDAIKR